MKISPLVLVNILFLPQSIGTAVPCDLSEYVLSESIESDSLTIDGANTMTQKQTEQSVFLDDSNNATTSSAESSQNDCSNCSNDTYEATKLFLMKTIGLIKRTAESNNENDLVLFVKQNSSNILFLRGLSLLFSRDCFAKEQRLFVEIMLCSDIEIFDYWYKMILIIASNSKNSSLSRRATDILEYYSEEFNEIEMSNVFN